MERGEDNAAAVDDGTSDWWDDEVQYAQWLYDTERRYAMG
jgi:hypothetical protein